MSTKIEYNVQIDKIKWDIDKLKHFLGMRVFVKCIHPKSKMPNSVETLESFNLPIDDIETDKGYIRGCDSVYPILRPAEDLNEFEIAVLYSVDTKFSLLTDKNDQDLFYADFTYFDKLQGVKFPISTQAMLCLLKIGAGAIPNAESHTGYVDFIHGLPCYTPKMIEEMGL